MNKEIIELVIKVEISSNTPLARRHLLKQLKLWFNRKYNPVEIHYDTYLGKCSWRFTKKSAINK